MIQVASSRSGYFAAALLCGWLNTALWSAEPIPAPHTPASPTNHWSLQSIESVLPPTTANRGWARNPIDSFIAVRLEAAGLQPRPEADRTTLIRRLAFDLTGLPPSPEEIDAFTEDPSGDAYERLVDRLLASPRFGERWARHWLDVVRYTESQGFEYDRLRDNAWQYRDYIIKSFNDDKPYTRFMQEQVAGDVLPPITKDGIIGASLLVCGSWDEAGNGQANVTQRLTTREEEMEDLISVVGQTFLGLTVNCARCHSHKFDPIPQTDYYRIKAVFEGVKHGERPIASPEEIAARDAAVNRLTGEITALEGKIARIEDSGRNAAKLARTNHASHASASGPALAGPEPLQTWRFDDPRRIAEMGSLEGGAVVTNGRLRLIQSGGFFRSKPLRRDIGEKTLEAWVELADLEQKGGAAISVEQEAGMIFDAIVFGERQPRKWTAGSEGFVRTRDLEAPPESASAGKLIHVVVTYSTNQQIAVFRNGERYGKPYPSGSPIPTFRSGEARVLLGMRHSGGQRPFLTGDILAASLHSRALTDAEIALLFRESPHHVSTEELLAHLEPAQQADRIEMMARLEQLRGNLAAIKPFPVSYAGLRKQPEPTHRLNRGDVKAPAEIVTPGALAAVESVNPDFGLTADAPEGERRLKFADWLVQPKNPLPARVMMNRIWHFHFGQGIVATPNDFGKSGALPSHPALLDWLARQFIDSGWSLKSMHRLIVTSATYRQSSRFDDAAARVDAENQLLWRFQPRRLEAEVLRDAMLSVSGQIHLQMGGPSFRSFDILTFPANSYAPIDKIGPNFNRRSVYRMNVNSGKEPLMDAFDCPDPAVKTPRRGVTTTPLQALSLMNNSFVLRQADHLAKRVQATAQDDLQAAIQSAYRYALGRRPTRNEIERDLVAARERGLSHICWVLLNSTEFVYVQ